MRTPLALLAALAAVPALAGCAGGIRQLDLAGIPTATTAELQADPAAFGFGAGGPPGPLVIRFLAGEEVPLRLLLDVPFAELEAGRNALRLRSDLWVHLGPDGAFLSPDGRRWAPLDDTDALHDLFGFASGSLTVGLGVNAEAGAALTLGLEAR